MVITKMTSISDGNPTLCLSTGDQKSVLYEIHLPQPHLRPLYDEGVSPLPLVESLRLRCGRSYNRSPLDGSPPEYVPDRPIFMAKRYHVLKRDDNALFTASLQAGSI